MPSPLHEGVIELLRKEPRVLLKLLTPLLPKFSMTSYEVLSHPQTEFINVNLPEYRADFMMELQNQQNDKLMAIIEVQLKKSAQKQRGIPSYVTGTWTRHECPTIVVVIALEEDVAAYYRQPIDMGLGLSVVRPVVLGPQEIPWVTDPAVVQACPELAVLSVLAHRHEPGVEEIAAPTLEVLLNPERLDTVHDSMYIDLIEGSLNEIARVALEKIMQTRGYEFQTETARKYVNIGRKEGREEGREEGLEEMLLTMVEARGFVISEAVRTLIANCHDVNQFKTWATRVLTAKTLKDIFSELE